MLNGVLTLHDIRDTEAYCAAVIKRSRLKLTPTQHEDLLAYLVEEAWLLSTTYDPGNPQYPPRFSVIAGQRLPLRIIDWQRQRHGRTHWQFKDSTYQRDIPTFIPLDHPLVNTHTYGPLDDQTHSRTDQQRLHHNRDRTNDRPYPNLDRTPARTTT
jgi:hypothetical protein